MWNWLRGLWRCWQQQIGPPPEFYLLEVSSFGEPTLHGPYRDDEERLQDARDKYEFNYHGNHSYVRLNVDDFGIPHVVCFTNHEMEDEPGEADL